MSTFFVIFKEYLISAFTSFLLSFIIVYINYKLMKIIWHYQNEIMKGTKEIQLINSHLYVCLDTYSRVPNNRVVTTYFFGIFSNIFIK